MKTSLILLACLLALTLAQRGPGGRGGGRGRGGPKPKCGDGSRPTCSDGSQPPCSDSQPPLTCSDGSSPTDRDGNPFCAREDRLCCDGSSLPEPGEGRSRGPKPKCEDGEKPVCSLEEC